MLKVFSLFNPTASALRALLLGALAVAAFEPVGFAPVALLSLAGLFWLWSKSDSALDSMRLGLWFGLGQFGVGVSWLISSMYVYSNMALPVALAATFSFVLFLSLFVLFTGWLVYFFRQVTPGLQFALLMPLVWVFVEWLRSTAFGGFPFLLMGTSHLGTWLDGYAPVFGVLGISWALALSAGVLIWIYQTRSWFPASLLFGVVWVSASYLKQVEWVTPVGGKVGVALIQGNIPQEKKWLKSEFMPSMRTYVKLTKESLGADVILWPETAIPAYYDVVEKGALYSFIKDAKLLEADILLGVIVRDPEDKSQYYNGIVNAHDPEQVYLKSHLVPFSEFFPFASFFKSLSLLFDIPFSEFQAGDFPQPLMTLGEHQVGLSVCYEMFFGSELAVTAGDAAYLLTVSNDAWFAHTLEPAQLLQEVQMRALELGREIGRATNTGYTAIIGVDGQIKAEIPAYQTGALQDSIQPYEGTTPFVYWKNLPLIFLFSLGFAFLFLQRWLLRKMFRETLDTAIKEAVEKNRKSS